MHTNTDIYTNERQNNNRKDDANSNVGTKYNGVWVLLI